MMFDHSRSVIEAKEAIAYPVLVMLYNFEANWGKDLIEIFAKYYLTRPVASVRQGGQSPHYFFFPPPRLVYPLEFCFAFIYSVKYCKYTVHVVQGSVL